MNGAYYATPWGTNVNEGVPEWPPSTWRLFRAIVSAWKTTRPDLGDETVWPILTKMAEQPPPKYRLPDASVSHTRHYMPTNRKPNLVLNTCVVTEKKPLYIIWDDLTLTEYESGVLKGILENINYFGRAESWCTIELATGVVEPNCVSLGDQNLADADLVSVLTPSPDIRFVDTSTRSKKDTADLRSISVTTTELQNSNYIDPPGGRWVRYQRPKNCFEPKISHATTTSRLDNIHVVRYAIIGTVRPPITDTLRVGDLARRACMSIYNQMTGNTSSTFSGKAADGKILKGHAHASYLPTYESQKRELDHLTIISPTKFNAGEVNSMLELKALRTRNRPVIRLFFQDCWARDNLSDVPILRESRVWVSSTPFILTRHTKVRGQGGAKRIVDGLEDQIRSEIEKRYGPKYADCLDTIEPIDARAVGYTRSGMNGFFRWRQHGSVGDGRTHNIRLVFSKPVKGSHNLGVRIALWAGNVRSGESVIMAYQSFDEFFKAATGYTPYPYQQRLAKGVVPDVVSAPTGSGKTEMAVLGLWLWGRIKNPENTPLRLVYCLPMRVLADQTVSKIKGWLENLNLDRKIEVKLLMGGSSDKITDLLPYDECVIVGTQDMLISGALNRAYGNSPYSWPIIFGMLNNDCMWIMDEIQTMANTLPTSIQLDHFRRRYGAYGPHKTVWMSATVNEDWLRTADSQKRQVCDAS